MSERRRRNTRTLILILTNLVSLGCLVWTLRDAQLSELKDDIASMDKVQSLSKWAINAALARPDGFHHVGDPDIVRPGYTLYGLPPGTVTR